MFDGDAGTASDADAGAARALYQRGLQEAAAWNDSGKSLVALYGQEWGVIADGGHLHIFNAPSLLGWERHRAGALLADVETPRHDYAGLYALMRKHGWYGQFNHPRADQFAIDGQPLGWSADGDASMLLCEVMNSHAYSTRTDETEARHSSYEAACNRLLEAGYHVAFSSNQDNHCANWGASYGNRTGVLLPRGQRLDAGTLLAALQARRVFATMDKHSAIVLTAGRRQPADDARAPGAPAPLPTPADDVTEHLMGARFAHQGELVLRVRHLSSTGRRVAAVRLFHGMPGRRGTVSAVSDSDYTVLTPPPGAHFYYARITQDDGTQLWSAPVWVDQRE